MVQVYSLWDPMNSWTFYFYMFFKHNGMFSIKLQWRWVSLNYIIFIFIKKFIYENNTRYWNLGYEDVNCSTHITVWINPLS